MTRLPLEDRNVRGVEGNPYPPHERCASPSCNEPATDRHHLWRRSFLCGDYWWVRLPDGPVVGNIVWLCSGCHRDVTENRARVVYAQGVFFFEWWQGEGRYLTRLDPQPPEYAGTLPEPEGLLASRDDASADGGRGPTGNPGPSSGSDNAPHLEPGKPCPQCLRRVPHPRKPSSPKTKPFAVRVPIDDVDTFVGIVDAAAEHMGLTDRKHHRYWALLYALTMALQTPGAAEIVTPEGRERAAKEAA